MNSIIMRLTIASLTVGLLTAGAAWMNSNYASAADVQALSKTIHQDRVERTEYNIQRTERQIKRLKSVPETKRSAGQKEELMELEHEKEYLLRKLDRIEKTHRGID